MPNRLTILSYVYHLFTITGESSPPQAVTHVAYACKKAVRRKEPNEMENKNQEKVWVKEGVRKTQWKRSTQNRWRIHTKY